MKKQIYNLRAYVHKNGQIMIRVRWSKSEVGFSVGYTIDAEKWDKDKQRVKANSTHKINGKTVYAREMNCKIRDFLSHIDDFFTECSLTGKIPTPDDLKCQINEKMGRIAEEKEPKNDSPKNLAEIFSYFLETRPQEGIWSKNAFHKYNQMMNQVTACDPNVNVDSIDRSFMLKLRNWYIKNDYCNRTIEKQFNILKSFLRWISRNGYNIQPGILDFKPQLKVIPKAVTFLKYKELMHFLNFEFPQNKEHLSKARDMFCFMAFTSLRYSDLAALKPSNLVDGYLDFCTEKTDDKLHIALSEHAQKIIEKYSWYKGEHLFPVPSNQKLNDYLKEAAKMAGLDREITQVYFKGNTRLEETCKFWEQISCHDARRTFVCCSLALGIPPSVVMSCTGHSDYESMKPYIEVADETQKMEMDKWNTHQYKSGIIERLDKMSSEQLKTLFDYIRDIV